MNHTEINLALAKALGVEDTSSVYRIVLEINAAAYPELVIYRRLLDEALLPRVERLQLRWVAQ